VLHGTYGISRFVKRREGIPRISENYVMIAGHPNKGDTLAAMTEVVSWPATVTACLCGGSTSALRCWSYRSRDAALAGKYEHLLVIVYVPAKAAQDGCRINSRAS